MGTIRINRGSAYADGMRSYKVLVDGNEVMKILNRQTVDIPVPPGMHTLQLKISLYGSRLCQVEVPWGEGIVSFDCRPTPSNSPLDFLIPSRHTWIDLQPSSVSEDVD